MLQIEVSGFKAKAIEKVQRLVNANGLINSGLNRSTEAMQKCSCTLLGSSNICS